MKINKKTYNLILCTVTAFTLFACQKDAFVYCQCKMYNYDIDKDISFKGSRSYEIPQYQIIYT